MAILIIDGAIATPSSGVSMVQKGQNGRRKAGGARSGLRTRMSNRPCWFQKRVGQKIDKPPNLDRQLLPAGIYRVNPQFNRTVIGQDSHQIPAFQILSNHETGLQYDAAVAQSDRAAGISVI